MRYVVEKRSWNGTEYNLVVDTADNSIVCSEPLSFYAYPEGSFIETVDDEGVEKMQRIADLLNASETKPMKVVEIPRKCITSLPAGYCARQLGLDESGSSSEQERPDSTEPPTPRNE